MYSMQNTEFEIDKDSKQEIKKSSEEIKKEITKHGYGVEESQNITVAKLQRMLPKGSSAQVTQEIVDMIKNIEDDVGLPQNQMEQEVMSYMHLVGKQGVSIIDVVNAVKFCSLKRNISNKKAWAIVFPSKYDKLIDEGRQIDNHVAMYNASKLVVAIDKEMMVPVNIQYRSYFDKAIKIQMKLAKGLDSNGNEASAMVQHLSAKALMETLKPIEDKNVNIKIGLGEQALAAQNEMVNGISELVANQRRMFEMGMRPDEIQKIHKVKINDDAIDISYDDVD